jgi:hypothetical protein
MKVGDLVQLNGTLWSSYGREGEAGLLLETSLMTNRNGYPDTKFSRVLWDNGEAKIYKSDHLEVISESR